MTVDEKYYIKVLLELTPPGPQIHVGGTSRMGVPEVDVGTWNKGGNRGIEQTLICVCITTVVTEK